MSSTGLVSPLKSPARASATQKRAQQLFNKSLGWKQRFRDQCLERISDIRANALNANRPGLSGQERRNGANSMSGCASSFHSADSLQMGMEETDREWLTQFMENELSTFDAYDDDDFIEHRLTEEDQVELLEDLNFAYYAEAQEDDYRQAEEHLEEERQLEEALTLLESDASMDCPVCRQNMLEEDESSISCPCGMRQDRILDHHNLENLYHSIAQLMEQHAQFCDGEPVFFCEEVSLLSYLFMGCHTCNNSESVL